VPADPVRAAPESARRRQHEAPPVLHGHGRRDVRAVDLLERRSRERGVQRLGEDQRDPARGLVEPLARLRVGAHERGVAEGGCGAGQQRGSGE
jgi:hypothetical protein